MNHKFLVFLFTCLMCGHAFALDKPFDVKSDRFYSVIGVGFSDGEVDNTSSSGVAYRFAIGYELTPQWLVELGYQSIVDDEGSESEEGYSAQALSVSLLGRAVSRKGELFYRVGLAYVDFSGQTNISTSGSCDVGSLSTVSSLCSVDEGSVGAVLGLGYDYYLDLRNELRFEIEYILADNQYSSTALFVNYKYNF
ncbi:outer membrane beta-barrel protein [Alteromonas sp. 5E99-2]|uniref:outer membrane beta-barrel protein n=1 Tax=Alteromonas sp. 5E99-2 TaxID=2817683 RepID=UPI001A992F26|nr:outer membrane beta-barrel protein [Alteromonas sp. 5E99-2]MBO1254188.1 outer membrane beta-barrel protein [Alteromonas sp. 5E99-2]